MPNYIPQARTTDATPLQLTGGPQIEADSVCRIPCFIFASDHAGNAAFWRIDVTSRRQGVLTPGVLKTVSVHQNTPGAAAAWAADIQLNGNDIAALVTGAAGQTIDWLFTNDDSFCMVGVFGG